MNTGVVLTTVFSLAATAGNVSVDPGPIMEREAYQWLSYHNGTPAWLTWVGTYRGVWFDIEDFRPGGGSSLIAQTELWFFHHSEHPWDTSNAYVELYNGDAAGPITLLDQQMITAQHFTPVYVYYVPPIQVDPDFWIVLNTELSAGGWPSLLGDNDQSLLPHSFFHDFINWEPWSIGGAYCNYFISAFVEAPSSLRGTSWGSLKNCFVDL